MLITLCHRCFHRGGRALGRRSGGRLRHDLLRNAAGGSCPSWRFGTGRSDGAREVPRAHGGAAGADSAALTAPTEERGPERPALPAVPLRAMPVAPRFRHGAVAAPACLPIKASLFSLVFYCPKRKSRSPTRCCFPSTRAGTGLQQEAAGSGLSDPGRRRPARHGSAGPLCAAPHRTAPHRAAPPRAVPTRLRSPTAAPARRAHPQLARSTAAARGRVTCPRDSGTSRQHTPPTPQRNATQRLPPGSPQAPRRSSSSARPAGQRGGAILPAEGLFRGAGGRGNSVDIGHVRGGAAPIAAAELDPTARGSGAPRGAAGGRIFSGGRGWRRGRPASTGP